MPKLLPEAAEDDELPILDRRLVAAALQDFFVDGERLVPLVGFLELLGFFEEEFEPGRIGGGTDGNENEQPKGSETQQGRGVATILTSRSGGRSSGGASRSGILDR